MNRGMVRDEVAIRRFIPRLSRRGTCTGVTHSKGDVLKADLNTM